MMSSKRKCRLCGESMGWALPDRVTSKNYEYAKRCLYMAKNTLVCGYTMKTKRIEHEQYCKHFVPKDEIELDYEENALVDELNNLENMIKEYEKQNEVIPKWAEQISINSSTGGRKASSPGARKRNGGLSVDGIDNQNISQKELLEFIQEVYKGNVVCPICKKNTLKLDDFQEHVPTSETYIRGVGYFVTMKISCQCGFENHFNSDWCRKGLDGTKRQIYRVGLAVGGVMEKPDFTYEKVEEIEAYSRKDAIEQYKKKHPRLANGYWSVSIVPDYY